nr:hypothetical protein BaRGS_007046 [Batillaria attramentaria]
MKWRHAQQRAKTQGQGAEGDTSEGAASEHPPPGSGAPQPEERKKEGTADCEKKQDTEGAARDSASDTSSLNSTAESDVIREGLTSPPPHDGGTHAADDDVSVGDDDFAKDRTCSDVDEEMTHCDIDVVSDGDDSEEEDIVM